MKILIFTDMHGSLDALNNLKKLIKKEKPSLILCAGDISIFSQSLDSLMEKIDKLGVRTLMLHGNHEEEEELAVLCKHSKNIEFFHKKTEVIDNILIMGYGGGGFALKDPEFREISSKWKKKFAKKKFKAKVLFTHAPPYNTVLDKLMGGGHCGNKDITKFIKDFKLDYAISGHIHDCSETTGKLGKTVIINPGPYGEIIDIK